MHFWEAWSVQVHSKETLSEGGRCVARVGAVPGVWPMQGWHLASAWLGRQGAAAPWYPANAHTSSTFCHVG